MAKISDHERSLYLEKIRPYREMINTFREQEIAIQTLIQKEQNAERIAVHRLSLVEDMLNMSSCYIVFSGIALSILKVKNEGALNDARKSLHKCIVYLEGQVSNLVDVPYGDYEAQLASLSFLSTAERYRLIRKIGCAIALLENAYGDNSKWRWSFVELEGRYAAVAKNLLDMKKAVVNTDPRSPDYETTIYLIRLIKKQLAQAADRYRERYELSTNLSDDFQQGIQFLSALKRFHALLGERTEAETVRKRMEIWSSKMEGDIKKKGSVPSS